MREIKKGTPPRVLEMLKKEFDVKLTKKSHFAKATGINTESISNYLTGKREPKIASLESMAQYWGVSTEWLLGFTDNPGEHFHEIVSVDEMFYQMACEQVRKMTPTQVRQLLQLADSISKAETTTGALPYKSPHS